MAQQWERIQEALQPVAMATPAAMPSDKAGWRALAEGLLRARSAPQRRAHAVRLAEDVTGLASALGATLVGLYSPVGAEVETRDLANALLARGVRLAYPRLRPDGLGMDFAASAGPTTLAQRPRSRLLEPIGAVVPPTELDLVVVPALGLRPDLLRLGRGGGHFDRYLPQVRADTVLIGCTAAACVFEWLPPESHDVAMHLAATETGLYRPAWLRTPDRA